MRLTFLGSGSFFCGTKNYHSNLLLETYNNKKLLIDCGSTCAFALAEAGYNIKDINAVYISHLHDDHAGGLEWLGYGSYFTPGMTKPELFAHESILAQLWEGKLKVSMEHLTEVKADLSTYFNVRRIKNTFEYDNVKFRLVPAIHVINNVIGHLYTYGLFFEVNGVKIYFTADLTYAQKEVDALDWDMDEHWKNYEEADYIFHDCETINMSMVHAHYDFLKDFPEAIKQKMYLYHTQGSVQPDAVSDGFLGIVRKGQVFRL